jgi:hypothetical protein
VAMYLVYVVGQVSADWTWVAAFSAWGHFATTALIDTGSVPAGDMALFALVALGGWGAALVAFRRRDLAA